MVSGEILSLDQYKTSKQKTESSELQYFNTYNIHLNNMLTSFEEEYKVYNSIIIKRPKLSYKGKENNVYSLGFNRDNNLDVIHSHMSLETTISILERKNNNFRYELEQREYRFACEDEFDSLYSDYEKRDEIISSYMKQVLRLEPKNFNNT